MSEELEIQLESKGTKLYFETRVPTKHELETLEAIEITSDKDWNPTDVELQQIQVMQQTDTFVQQVQMMTTQKKYEYNDPGSNKALLHEIDPSLSNIHARMIQNVKVKTKDMMIDRNTLEERRTFVSYERHTQFNARTISERFVIGPKKAEETLKVTTQKGVRSAILPISRRYRADRQYSVKRLNGRFATDTCYFKSKTFNQSIGSQIFSHKNGFAVNLTSKKPTTTMSETPLNRL